MSRGAIILINLLIPEMGLLYTSHQTQTSAEFLNLGTWQELYDKRRAELKLMQNQLAVGLDKMQEQAWF